MGFRFAVMLFGIHLIANSLQSLRSSAVNKTGLSSAMFGGEDCSMGTVASFHWLGATPLSNELLMISGKRKADLACRLPPNSCCHPVLARGFWQLLEDSQLYSLQGFSAQGFSALWHQRGYVVVDWTNGGRKQVRWFHIGADYAKNGFISDEVLSHLADVVVSEVNEVSKNYNSVVWIFGVKQVKWGYWVIEAVNIPLVQIWCLTFAHRHSRWSGTPIQVRGCDGGTVSDVQRSSSTTTASGSALEKKL